MRQDSRIVIVLPPLAIAWFLGLVALSGSPGNPL
jgi:hypothetical protein